MQIGNTGGDYTLKQNEMNLKIQRSFHCYWILSLI